MILLGFLMFKSCGKLGLVVREGSHQPRSQEKKKVKKKHKKNKHIPFKIVQERLKYVKKSSYKYNCFLFLVVQRYLSETSKSYVL